MSLRVMQRSEKVTSSSSNRDEQIQRLRQRLLSMIVQNEYRRRFRMVGA